MSRAMRMAAFAVAVMAGSSTNGAIIFEETFEAEPPQVSVSNNEADWGVVVDATSPHGPHVAKFGVNGGYPNNAGTVLFTPELTLPAAPSMLLIFHHRYDMEDGYDGARVWVTEDFGASYQPLQPQGGYPFPDVFIFGGPGYSGSSGWALAVFDLSALAGHGNVQFVFEFASDADNVTEPPGFEGFWSVDGLRVGDRESLAPYMFEVPEPAMVALLLPGLLAVSRRRSCR